MKNIYSKKQKIYDYVLLSKMKKKYMKNVMKKKLHIGLIISLVLILSFFGLAAAVILSEVHFPQIRHMRNGHNNIDRAIMRVYKRRNLENGDKTIQQRPRGFAGNSISDEMLSIQYEGDCYEDAATYIDNQYIDSVVNSKFKYNENMTITLYSIKGVSEKVALGAKKVGDETVYVFKNIEYKAKNLKEYMQEHGIHNGTNIWYVYLTEPKERFSIYYNGDTIHSMAMKEVLEKGADKNLTERNQDTEETGLKIRIYDNSGAVILTIGILENGDINVRDDVGGMSQQTFAWDDGILWGVNLIKELSEREKGGLEIWAKYN